MHFLYPFDFMMGVRKQVSRVIHVFLVITAIGLGKVYAMGDFSSVAYNFWTTTIDSYWWSTRKDYLGSWDIIDPQPPALLPGEVEPAGVEQTTHTLSARSRERLLQGFPCGPFSGTCDVGPAGAPISCRLSQERRLHDVRRLVGRDRPAVACEILDRGDAPRRC